MTRRCYPRAERPTVSDVQTPDVILAGMLAADPARPRLTFYDDLEGPTKGERIELSGKVLANWVAKAGNALQDEFDAGPGSVVALDLPALHWRTVYWAVAAWSVGATVEVAADGEGSGDAAAELAQHADVLVSTDLEADPGAGELVVVTLAALARSAPSPVPAGGMDEARELATHGDRFTAFATAGADEVALRRRGAQPAYRSWRYDELVPAVDWPGGVRVHLAGGDVAAVLRQVLAAWAVDGSVVLSRGAAGGPDLAARVESEGVTLDSPDCP